MCLDFSCLGNSMLSQQGKLCSIKIFPSIFQQIYYNTTETYSHSTQMSQCRLPKKLDPFFADKPSTSSLFLCFFMHNPTNSPVDDFYVYVKHKCLLIICVRGLLRITPCMIHPKEDILYSLNNLS